MQSMTMQVAPRNGEFFLVHIAHLWLEARFRPDGALEVRGRGLMREGQPDYPVSWKPKPGIPIGEVMN